ARECRRDEAGAAGDQDALAGERHAASLVAARNQTGSGTAGAAGTSPLRTAAEKASAPSVNPAAASRKTSLSETYCSPKPAARNPSGPITFAIVMTAVITFGRSGSSVRTVMTASIGALTNGAHRPNAASTTITTAHGIGIASSQSGNAIAKIATAASRMSGTFLTIPAVPRLPS